MKVVNIQCPNCKASLEMNLEKLMVYCPYCRTKLPMDFDVDNYISETEETKRHEQKTDVEKLEVERKMQENKLRTKLGIACVIAWVIFMVALLFSH